MTPLSDAWAALSPSLRRALSECTAFAGSFAIEAAEAVLSLGPDALDALHALTRHHLVAADAGRMELPAPVRAFVVAQTDPADRQETFARHAVWAARVADDLVARHRREPAQGDLERAAPDLRDVLERAGLGRVAAAHGIAAGRALCVLADARGPADRFVADATLALDPSAGAGEAWCDVAARRARWLLDAGDPHAADEARAAVAVADRLGEHRARARAQTALGACLQGAPARAALEEALALLDHADRDLRGAVLAELALVLDEPADAVLAEALAIAVADHDVALEARVCGNAAAIAVRRADFTLAERWNARARTTLTAAGDPRGFARALARDGAIADGLGDLERAASRYAEAEAAFGGVQTDADAARVRGERAAIALVRGDLGTARAVLDAAAAATMGLDPTLAAVLAAHEGDVASTRDHLQGAPPSALGALAGTAATALASEPGSDAARSLSVEAGAAWTTARETSRRRQIGDLLLRAVDRHAAGWLVARDGSWFRPPGAVRADLSNRRGLAHILCALVAAREAGTGPLDTGGLFEAGWPGERAVASAASNRVYVALSTLREAGLGPLLLRDDRGWSLDPAAVVRAIDP